MPFCLSLLTIIGPGGPGLAGTRILDFIGAKDDGGGGDNTGAVSSDVV